MEKESASISIIIVVHNEAAHLEENLPQFLNIAQEASAQVIVVDDMSSDDTPDVLQRLLSEHSNLYTTFLPKSVVPNPSRIRLALSIGIKAAKGQYLVFGDINRPPVSLEWLTGLADGEASVVYTSHKNKQVTHVVATSLEDLQALVQKAERKSGRGHQGQCLKLQRGLYDAFAVRKEKAFEALKYFDQDIKGGQLLALWLKTWL